MAPRPWEKEVVGISTRKSMWRNSGSFSNRFLKGIDNHVKDWPRVTLEIRERIYVGSSRTEREWPIARTRYKKLFLNREKREFDRIPAE